MIAGVLLTYAVARGVVRGVVRDMRPPDDDLVAIIDAVAREFGMRVREISEAEFRARIVYDSERIAREITAAAARS